MTEKQIRNQVVETVLSYLGCNEADGSHKKIIDLYNSHIPRARGYKVKYTDAWCATFVSAVAIECGLTDIMPTECSCTKMIELYKAKGRWQESDSYVPQPGDLIMYDWNDSGKDDDVGAPEHVGIVVSVNGESFTVVEGNYSNAVKKRPMNVNGRYIRGYCLPDYASKATVEEPKTQKTIEDIAREVINGKWGDGSTRKLKLYAAGYDYYEVQAEVNRILSGKKSITQIAKEVINGKWGNGAERKEKLKAAGYDPTEVQKMVNKLLNA